MSAEAVATALVARSGAVRAQPDQFVRLPGVGTDPAYVEGKHGAQRFLLA